MYLAGDVDMCELHLNFNVVATASIAPLVKTNMS